MTHPPPHIRGGSVPQNKPSGRELPTVDVDELADQIKRMQIALQQRQREEARARDPADLRYYQYEWNQEEDDAEYYDNTGVHLYIDDDSDDDEDTEYRYYNNNNTYNTYVSNGNYNPLWDPELYPYPSDDDDDNPDAYYKRQQPPIVDSQDSWHKKAPAKRVAVNPKEIPRPVEANPKPRMPQTNPPVSKRMPAHRTPVATGNRKAPPVSTG